MIRQVDIHRTEDGERLDSYENTALKRLRAQLLERWASFPSEWSEALDCELEDGLKRAVESEPEIITVMNPVSRPMHLRLAALVSDVDLDEMYKLEWAELAVSDRGRCYLVYRRRDGEDYAIEWSPTTNLPATMMSLLSEPLAAAVLGGDDNDES